jgi:HD-like signal output (HDOD) protein
MTVATASYVGAALKTEELHRCWRHTLACAIISEELGRVCSLGGDRAYNAGLLHDLLTVSVTGTIFTLTFLLTYYLASR